MSEKDQVLVLSLVVGVFCGLASVVLKLSIEWLHHLLTSWFDGNFDYNFLYLVYPGIGMLLSMLFVRYVIRDNIGHGVTRVLLAVSKNESKIRPHNIWSSLVASSVTIGFGGSVGAEAPIVYTGAAIGSNVGRKMGLSYKNITILLSSHILSELQQTATTFGFLAKGKLVEEIGIRELTEKCADYLEIALSDVAAFAAILDKERPQTRYIVTPDNKIRLYDAAPAYEFSKLAAEHGILVSELEHHACSLEDYYMNLKEGHHV